MSPSHAWLRVLTIGSVFGPSAVLAAPTGFHNTGQADYVVAVESGASQVCTNDSLGTSFTCTGLALSFSARTAAAGDLDGDGFKDIVLVGNTSLKSCLNDGAGGFEACTTIRTHTGNPSPPRLTDLDFDGDLDIVGALGSASEVFWCLDDGTAGYACDVLSTHGLTNSVALADVDGDLYRDLIYADSLGGPRYCLNDGLGDFSACIPIDPAATGVQAALLPGDIDDDGDMDLVATGSVAARVCVNDGQLRFTCSDIAALGPTHGGVLVDLDGDGDPDLAVARLTGAPPGICLNDGLGGFTCTDLTSAAGLPGFDLGASDFDLDGDPDLVFSYATPPATRQDVCLNDGTATFTCSLQGVPLVSTGLGVSDPYDPNPDADGDGRLDDVDLCVGNDFSGDTDGDGVCNDFDFGMIATRVVPGEPMTFWAYNVPVVGTTVQFLVSQRGLGTEPCIGATCGDLDRPILISAVGVAGDRTAELTLDVPRFLAPGTPLFFQALWTDGARADSSGVLSRVVRP